jgi:DNA invertase Pin-like site-specific DNA recombinase
MALIGYACASTEDQHLEMQLAQLHASCVERIYREKISGAKTDRPELMALLDYVREGDTAVCC